MLGRTATAYILLALGLNAAAAPAPDAEPEPAADTIWDPYATFYDDKNCNDNAGIGVDLNNDGCLNEGKSSKDSPSPAIMRLRTDHNLTDRTAGRGSVHIPNYRPELVGSTYSMCTYHEADCKSPIGKPWWFTSTGFCQSLDTAGAKSYKFKKDGLGDC